MRRSAWWILMQVKNEEKLHAILKMACRWWALMYLLYIMKHKIQLIVRIDHCNLGLVKNKNIQLLLVLLHISHDALLVGSLLPICFASVAYVGGTKHSSEWPGPFFACSKILKSMSIWYLSFHYLSLVGSPKSIFLLHLENWIENAGGQQPMYNLLNLLWQTQARCR